MHSQSKIGAKIRNVEQDLRNKDEGVPEYEKGKLNALEQISEDPNPDTCLEVIEKSKTWNEYWDNMMMSPMAGFPGFGEIIVRKSAYYDGMIMAALDALQGDIEYQDDKVLVTHNGETVEV